MKSQKIWNKIVALKLFFVCSFEMDFGAFRYFLALVALKCICYFCRFENVSWAVVALKIFLALFSLNIVFWRLSLRKWFFALVAVKITFGFSRFKKCLSLTSLKMIFLVRFENFLALFWKCFFGGHRFENSFLALVVLKIVFWHL